MLDIKILAVGKIKEEPIKELIAEYQKRIKPFCRLEIIELAETPFSASNMISAKEKEGDKILETLARFPDSFTIAMDERGAEYDSAALAHYLEKQNKAIVMVVGGTLGLSQKVLDRSQASLALSRLTFTHGMARLFLLEQIYRAGTILSGKAYHY